jgi:hypothetical protein
MKRTTIITTIITAGTGMIVITGSLQPKLISMSTFTSTRVVKMEFRSPTLPFFKSINWMLLAEREITLDIF